MGKFSLLGFPCLDQISGPEDVDKGINENKDIVETSKTAAAHCTYISLLHPQQNLYNHGQKQEREGFDGQKFHELKVKGYFLTTVITNTLCGERFE